MPSWTSVKASCRVNICTFEPDVGSEVRSLRNSVFSAIVNVMLPGTKPLAMVTIGASVAIVASTAASVPKLSAASGSMFSITRVATPPCQPVMLSASGVVPAWVMLPTIWSAPRLALLPTFMLANDNSPCDCSVVWLALMLAICTDAPGPVAVTSSDPPALTSWPWIDPSEIKVTFAPAPIASKNRLLPLSFTLPLALIEPPRTAPWSEVRFTSPASPAMPVVVSCVKTRSLAARSVWVPPLTTVPKVAVPPVE